MHPAMIDPTFFNRRCTQMDTDFMKDRTPLVFICVDLRSSVVYLQERKWQYASKRQTER